MLTADEAPEEMDLFHDIADEVTAELEIDSSGHDLHHAWRVFNLGVRLAAAEGADETVVGAAALTHDLHRVVGGDEFVHPEETLPEVRSILEGVGFPGEKVPAVLHCVAVHEEYGFDYGHAADETGAETLEAEIVQDADNLDAIGAVGIARAFQFGGARGHPMWAPEEGDGHGSTLEHFEEKLLNLADDMNTDAGRDLAADRHEFTAAFVERFGREWRGDA